MRSKWIAHTDVEKLLHQACQAGIIDLDSLEKQMQEINRKKILQEQHRSKIWQGQSKSKGKIYTFFYTYLPDPNKAGKKKLVKKSSLEKLEDAIVKFYSEKEFSIEEIKTFKTALDGWIAFKSKIVSDATIYRYNKDYKRFFKGTDFENIPLVRISEEMILVFLSETVKRLSLNKKAFQTLCGYIKEILDSALVNHYISSNPFVYVKPKLKLIAKSCSHTTSSADNERTLSKQEVSALITQIKIDHINKPDYITPFAVELAFMTGLRIGELSALRWSDICNGVLTIRSSEKTHRPKNASMYYTVEGTKTGKERKIPMTSDIENLFERVAEAVKNAGYSNDNEFVFINKDGRIKSINIDRYLERKCKQVGIERKTIHDIRRTVNSALRGVGATAIIAASIMGHTVEVNEEFYTYDISELSTKKKLLEKVAQSITAKAV